MKKSIRRPSTRETFRCNYWQLRWNKYNDKYNLYLLDTDKEDRKLDKPWFDVGITFASVAYYRDTKETDEHFRKELVTKVLGTIDEEIARLQKYKVKVEALL